MGRLGFRVGVSASYSKAAVWLKPANPKTLVEKYQMSFSSGSLDWAKWEDTASIGLRLRGFLSSDYSEHPQTEWPARNYCKSFQSFKYRTNALRMQLNRFPWQVT